MIQLFEVSNFKSIKDTISLNMSDINDTNKVLPVNAIFGPNSAGKTNIYEALRNLVLFIQNPYNNKNLMYQPFAYDNGESKPSTYQITFDFKDLSYNYYLEVDVDGILYEKLDYCKFQESNEGITIFERDDKSVEFNLPYNVDLEDGKNTLILNKLIYDYKDDEIISGLHEYFTKGIQFYKDKQSIAMSTLLARLQIVFNPAFKNKMLELIRAMDFNIEDFEISNYDTVQIIHKYENAESMTFNLEDESSGFIKIFKLAPYLLYSLINGYDLVVDNLDSNLHTLTTRYITTLYRCKETVNTNNAQLLFTGHDVALIDCSCLNKEDVWFVDKHDKIGVSHLYSLVEFKERPKSHYQDNVRYFDNFHDYLLGCYGAIPVNKEFKLDDKVEED